MAKFKVGDIVTGNSNSAQYVLTNSNSICEVMQVDGEHIKLKILKFINKSYSKIKVGTKHWVNSYDFDLYEEKKVIKESW